MSGDPLEDHAEEPADDGADGLTDEAPYDDAPPDDEPDDAAPTDAAGPAVATVSVMGSCITRDNFNSRFNPDYKRWFRVGPTTNQSSMIALMSAPVDEPWQAVKPMKPYGQWNVASDLTREILELLPAERPDLVVLDFFGDVHFGVIRLSDGRYVTDNRWRIHKTDLHERLLADPAVTHLHWQDDPDAYFAVWVEAMDRFAAFMAAECPGTRVVVHCGFNVDRTIRRGAVAPTGFGPPKRQRAARAGSRFWRRLNEHARTAYGWESIDLGAERYVTFADHPWGAMEVHYTMDYYPRFLAELHRIALRTDPEVAGDPAIAATIDEIATAAAARVRAEVDWWRGEDEVRAHAAAEAARPRWKRLLRPAPKVARPPEPTGDRPDDTLLAGLRDRVSPATYERVEALSTSADGHIAWLRETGTARLALTDRG
ncbi:DUF6270 domain-containing protein [Nocardioides caeni]|uniref:Uncharacterized protein n=1 Tax=Nocardioides caeni TaxID=574700 RepID=A0A4S8NCV6_9ACTN|nr:DUF6270 domain-containing protein [Nocardioides caeni]THV12939.1 hypothetical protein E9934_11215 [Nocardioides caeni]